MEKQTPLVLVWQFIPSVTTNQHSTNLQPTFIYANAGQTGHRKFTTLTPYRNIVDVKCHVSWSTSKVHGLLPYRPWSDSGDAPCMDDLWKKDVRIQNNTQTLYQKPHKKPHTSCHSLTTRAFQNLGCEVICLQGMVHSLSQSTQANMYVHILHLITQWSWFRTAIGAAVVWCVTLVAVLLPRS